MYLGKETSTLGITGLTFLRIASPWVGKVPPCRLLLLQDVYGCLCVGKCWVLMLVFRARLLLYTLTYINTQLFIKLNSWIHDLLQLLVSGCMYMLVFVSRARDTNTNTHRVHLPTLGLDGQVYVCMCMGRYSVWYVGSRAREKHTPPTTVHLLVLK